jgi:glycosyltransferase involved in cell wall biosynthesis
MIFSIHTDDDVKDANGTSGYSYGYNRIEKHFSQFKHKGKKFNVKHNDPTSPIQMFYMEPERYNPFSMKDLRSPGFRKFHPHQYKIIGTHHETTILWDHWIDTMNSVDEIWVGNFFTRDACLNSGIKTPVYVFEHGIDDMWKPFKRGLNSKIRFLHVDSDSPRKRADLALEAFKAAFGDDPNVELTLKYHSSSSYSVMDLFNRESKIPENKNINKIYETLSHEQMVDLYNSHDVLVYPSEGEGFGFIPLQALATGMPTISTGVWCSYEEFLGKNIIESKMGPTKSTGYRTGDVVLPDFDSLVYLMRNVYENIGAECEYYYKQAPSVYKKYNWQTRSDRMLSDTISRLGEDMFKQDSKFEYLIPREIRYVGNGAYCTSNGHRFTRENPICKVSYEEYHSLINMEEFADV